MKIFQILVITLITLGAQLASAKTLLVLGDSLSAAYGIQQQQGWVALLEKRLGTEYPDVTVVNASISGETTSGGLTRLPKLLDRHQPAYIVLELAANDGLRGTSLAVIKHNLSQLITLSQKAGAKVLVVGIRLPPNYGPRYTEKFFNLFELMATQYGTYRAPFLMEDVALKPELIQADRLHPTAAAQPILLENVWPDLKAMLDSE